jgi:hypothetical protein
MIIIIKTENALLIDISFYLYKYNHILFDCLDLGQVTEFLKTYTLVLEIRAECPVRSLDELQVLERDVLFARSIAAMYSVQANLGVSIRVLVDLVKIKEQVIG